MTQASPIDLHIGRRICDGRSKLQMTQQELADAIGISVEEIRGYEAGEKVDASLLFLIAKILEQPITFFYRGI